MTRPKVVTCEPGELERIVEENAHMRLVGMVRAQGRAANGATWPLVKLVYAPQDSTVTATVTDTDELADLRGRVARVDEYLRTTCEMNADVLARVALGILRG